MTKTNQELIHQSWKEISESFSHKFKSFNLELFQDQFVSIFTAGPAYYYVINFSSYPDIQFSFVHESAEKFYGIPADKLTISELMERIHEDDVLFMTQCERRVGEFLADLDDPLDSLNYKFCYTFRLKNKNNKYRMIYHQALGILTDDAGKLAHVLGIHTDVTHFAPMGTRTMSIIGINGRPIYHGIDPYEDFNLQQAEKEEIIFTARELEIIGYMAKGYTAAVIAETLLVSVNTIQTHRKNILKKSGCNNSVELVTYCIRNGII